LDLDALLADVPVADYLADHLVEHGALDSGGAGSLAAGCVDEAFHLAVQLAPRYGLAIHSRYVLGRGDQGRQGRKADGRYDSLDASSSHEGAPNQETRPRHKS
jgi:hypothetical protein